MIYRILVDGYTVHESGTNDKEYQASSSKLQLKVNKSGTLTFKVPAINAVYRNGNFVKLKSEVEVYMNDTLLWNGRILDTERDFFNNITVKCEGWLSILMDSVVRPTLSSSSGSSEEGTEEQQDSITVNPGTYFNQLITWHNQMVDSYKALTPYTKGWGSETYEIKDSSYDTTLDYFQSQFLNNEEIGGRVWVIGNKIYYYADGQEDENSQEIIFGENLLDLSEYIDSSEIYTCLIPIGKDDLKIGDPDYVSNANAVALYGKIFRSQSFSDIEDAETLRTEALKVLNKAVEEAVTLELTAFDLSLINPDFTTMKLGSLTRIISPPHGIDALFMCSAIDYDLCNPGNTVYTLGVNPSSLTDRQNKLVKNITGARRYNSDEKSKKVDIAYSIVSNRCTVNSIIFYVLDNAVFLSFDINASDNFTGRAVNLLTFASKYAPKSALKVIGTNTTQDADQQFIIVVPSSDSSGRIQVNAQALNIAQNDNLTCTASWFYK